MALKSITVCSVLLIVGPKCTPAASRAAPGESHMSMPTGQTHGRTPHRYITLSLDAARVMTAIVHHVRPDVNACSLLNVFDCNSVAHRRIASMCSVV